MLDYVHSNCWGPSVISTLGMNRTLLERARCILSNSRWNKSLWDEAVSVACYIVNHSPSTTIDFKTLIEVWSNKPAKYSMLKVFGCLEYFHASEGKLEPKANKGFFMGYGDGVKGFWVWSHLKERSFWVEMLSMMNSLCYILNMMKIWARLRMSLSRWSLRAP